MVGCSPGRAEVRLLRSNYTKVTSSLNTHSPKKGCETTPAQNEPAPEGAMQIPSAESAGPPPQSDLAQIKSELDVLQTTLKHMREELTVSIYCIIH